MKIIINELEQDLIREVINIGLKKTADSFSKIAQQQITLHIPEIHIVEPSKLQEILNLQYDRTVTVVQSDIKGHLNGKTFIVFSEENAARLAEIAIGAPGEFKGNYPAMRRSLLLETSNILTGSLITQLANIFNIHLYGTPPMAVPYSLRKSFNDLLSDFPIFKPFVLTVKTKFVNSGRQFELPMVLVFDMDAIEAMTQIIRSKSSDKGQWLKAYGNG